MPLPIHFQANNSVSPPVCAERERVNQEKLTGAGRSDEEHANLLGTQGLAADIFLLKSLYARLESLELGVKVLDLVFDQAHREVFKNWELGVRSRKGLW